VVVYGFTVVGIARSSAGSGNGQCFILEMVTKSSYILIHRDYVRQPAGLFSAGYRLESQGAPQTIGIANGLDLKDLQFSALDRN